MTTVGRSNMFSHGFKTEKKKKKEKVLVLQSYDISICYCISDNIAKIAAWYIVAVSDLYIKMFSDNS